MAVDMLNRLTEYGMRFLQYLFMLIVLSMQPALADAFLDPSQAFVYSAKRLDATHIEVDWVIADHCFLYRDKLQFTLHGATAGAPQLPEAEVRNDPVMGREMIYQHALRVILPFTHPTTTPLSLEASAQGCSDQGICYAPIHYHTDFSSGDIDQTQPNETTQPPPLHDMTTLLEHGSLLSALIAFFVAGLLLSLTPCVFPMIPILSGIIVGQRHHSRLGSFMLSLSYVIGMSLTYSLAGVAAALSGTLISNSLQNPMVLGTVAILFVLLSLSMFGLYELQLPASVQTRFSGMSNRFQGGHLLGTFLMGVISALIVGPCVAPPLAAALTWIAKTGNVWLGGSALFALSIGMGAPLLLIGLTSGSVLPRAGTWMNGIRQLFGVLMLGVAIWLINPLLAPVMRMMLWAALFIVSGVAWHAIDPLPTHATGWQRLWKGISLIVLITGISLWVGALSGSRDLLHPLSALAQTRATAIPTDKMPDFVLVHSQDELQKALASDDSRPVLLDFYADWCVSCKEMDSTTLQEPAVMQALSAYHLIRVDLTGNTPDEDALRKQYGIFGPPAMLHIDKDGHVLGEPLNGLQPAEVVLPFLEQPVH